MVLGQYTSAYKMKILVIDACGPTVSKRQPKGRSTDKSTTLIVKKSNESGRANVSVIGLRVF